MDYLLVPRSAIRSVKIFFGDHNFEALEEWRYETVDKLINAIMLRVEPTKLRR